MSYEAFASTKYNTFFQTQTSAPIIDEPADISMKNSADQVSNIHEWQDETGVVLAAINNAGVVMPVQAATESQPAYVKGGIYFDTTLNKLMVGGETGWEIVTSALPA